MELDISNYISPKSYLGFVVHAPELFSQGRLMDLASVNENHLAFSIKETQRVIDITRELKNYFPATKRLHRGKYRRIYYGSKAGTQ